MSSMDKLLGSPKCGAPESTSILSKIFRLLLLYYNIDGPTWHNLLRQYVEREISESDYVDAKQTASARNTMASNLTTALSGKNITEGKLTEGLDVLKVTEAKITVETKNAEGAVVKFGLNIILNDIDAKGKKKSRKGK